MLLYQTKRIRTGFVCVRGHDLTGSSSKLCYSGLFPWECQLIFKIQMALPVGDTALPFHFTQFIPCGLMRRVFQKVSLFVAGMRTPGEEKLHQWMRPFRSPSIPKEFINNANSRASFLEVLI